MKKEPARICSIITDEDELRPGSRYKKSVVTPDKKSCYMMAVAENYKGPLEVIIVLRKLREENHYVILGILNFTKEEIDRLSNEERKNLLREAVLSGYSDDTRI